MKRERVTISLFKRFEAAWKVFFFLVRENFKMNMETTYFIFSLFDNNQISVFINEISPKINIQHSIGINYVSLSICSFLGIEKKTIIFSLDY